MITVDSDVWPVTEWLHIAGPYTSEHLYQATLNQLVCITSFRLLPDDEQMHSLPNSNSLSRIFRYHHEDESGNAILVSDANGVSLRISHEKTCNTMIKILREVLNK